MLRTLMLCFGSLLATSTLHAQHVSLGVKAGLNASTYGGGDVPNPRFRLGPAAGVLVRLKLGPYLDLQPEVLYEQRGARTSYKIPFDYYASAYAFTHQERSRLHDVSLAVLLRLHRAKWFVVAGPQVSHLLAAQRRVTQASQLLAGPLDPRVAVGPTSTTIRGVYNYHRWNLGYAVGVGYQVAARVGVELRYAASFTQVQQPRLDPDILPVPRAVLARNRVVQTQLNYQLSRR